MYSIATLFTVVTFFLAPTVNAASKDKPHTHQGVLNVLLFFNEKV